jgi:hypothetical protein
VASSGGDRRCEANDVAVDATKVARIAVAGLGASSSAARKGRRHRRASDADPRRKPAAALHRRLLHHFPASCARGKANGQAALRRQQPHPDRRLPHRTGRSRRDSRSKAASDRRLTARFHSAAYAVPMPQQTSVLSTSRRSLIGSIQSLRSSRLLCMCAPAARSIAMPEAISSPTTIA